MPTDINGDPVVCGTWYWAMGRTGIVVGAGKFEETWSTQDRIGFFINGIGYDPGVWRYVQVVPPPEALFVYESARKPAGGIRDESEQGT